MYYVKRLFIICSLLLLQVGPARADETLRVVSWSGAYLKSQILGFIRPFEEATGVDVEVIQYSGGLDEIRSQVRSYNVRWDVVDFELFDALRACEEDLLLPIDPADLSPAPDGTPPVEDFIAGSLTDCGVGGVLWSTTVAYHRERVPDAPERLEDFFDLDRFPGPRGLRRTPMVNLEWALLSDGVEPGRIYEVLSTGEGVDRAFDILTRIKPAVVWWETGVEAIRHLEDGTVTMSSVYSGRVHDAVQRGRPIDILWDHQVWFIDVWGIPRHGENTELARRFVRYATSTESLARQVQHIPYGPVRKSSMPQVPENLRQQLPTAEANFATALEGNAAWWSEHLDELTARFDRWADRPVMVPKELPHSR